MILDDVSLVSYDFTCFFLLYMMLDDFICCFFCDFILQYCLHCFSVISFDLFYEFTDFYGVL